MLKEQMKALNQKMTEKAGKVIDMQNFSLFPEARLPVVFRLQHIKKFFGNTPSYLHFIAYVWTTQLYGLNEGHMAQCFHQTLTGFAHNWFLGLERHMVFDWKSIIKEFMEHYKSNEELKIT